MGAFSIWHWLIVLAIVVVVFGTKKLRNMGGDLGSAIKSFREGVKESESASTSSPSSQATNKAINSEDKETTCNQQNENKTKL